MQHRNRWKETVLATVGAAISVALVACGSVADDRSGDSAGTPPTSSQADMGRAGEAGMREGRVNPDPSGTVLDAAVNPDTNQAFCLWGEAGMPSTPDHSGADMRSGDDGVGFRPTVVTYPVAQGTDVKGAVLVNSGGAFQFRSNGVEGEPTALALAELGYQSLLVNYRLLPFSQGESAPDLQRAVRFVRAHVDDYGSDPRDIAVMGFSAGGILSGRAA